MTATTTPDKLPSISIENLRVLNNKPGALQVTIKKVDGYFMPIVRFVPPVGDTILCGVITEGSDVVATVDLADALAALEAILGNTDSVVMPKSADTPTLH